MKSKVFMNEIKSRNGIERELIIRKDEKRDTEDSKDEEARTCVYEGANDEK